MIDNAPDPTGDAGLDAVLARLEAGVRALAEVDLSALVRLDGPSSGLHAAARRVEAVKRALAAFDAHYVTALEVGDEPARHCQPSSAAFLRHQLKITPADATRRVRLAHATEPGSSFSAEPLPAPCPAVAAAVGGGLISIEHADVVVKTLQALPETARKDHGAAVEAELTTQAESFDPTVLARLARHTLHLLDPDGTLRDADWQDQVRAATLQANPDGTGSLRAHLSAEALAKLQAALTPLAAPVPAGPDGPDPRSAAQRLHDALLDLTTRALASGDLPASGGTPTTVVIHLTEEQLRRRSGLAVTDHGTLMPVETAVAMAGESTIYSLVTTSTRVPLYLGRTSRLATPGQTIALAARDRGCAHPGCDRPPAMTERHHIREWVADGGPTDIDNVLLLCGFHHREHKKRGWTIVMTGGLPHFIPPRWVDPDQRPIRNTMHDPPPT